MSKLRELLSDRLRGLMEVTPSLDTQTKLSKRAGVSQSTVQRILSRDASATVDSVEDLGKAFGLRPPSLLLLEEIEAELLKVWGTLNELDRGEVQRYALSLAQRHSSAHAPRLDFEVKREVPPSHKAANMRASARPPKEPHENDQCPPTVTNRAPGLKNSAPSPPRRRQTPKG